MAHHTEHHCEAYNVIQLPQYYGVTCVQVLNNHNYCKSSFASSATSSSFTLLPIASASAATPRFSLLRLLLPDHIHFSCYSPIASASAAAPRLRPLQLLLPDCVRFSCSSPIASTLAAAPQLRPFQLSSQILEGSNPCASIHRARGSVYLVRRPNVTIV